MTSSSYRDPTIRNVILGILLFAVFLVAVCSLPQVVKTLGAGLLYLPSRLGLVEMVHRDQIQAIDMRSSPPQVDLPQARRYAVYTDDYDLLVMSDEILRIGAEPWLVVLSPGSHAELRLTGVERGLMPYDSPYAAGRPVFTFEVLEPGVHDLIFPRRAATFYILPDTTSGKERLILLAYAVEVAILGTAVGLPYWRAVRNRRARLAAMLPPRPAQADEFWRTESRRQRHNPRRRP
ncbi:MAG: hypothetical protein NTY23_02845 [Chloroflexi bacterium]|nr:hypothetical protein [Chloroflexota bacterium]